MTDILRWPLFGGLADLRTRRALQVVLLAAAAAIVAHGLWGPQVAPRNTATVLVWVHYRGLLLLALVAVGSLFCTACPMMLVRDAARRVVEPRFTWPRALRNKWLAIGLLAAGLYAYELFDLWSLPATTALIVVGYFAAALLVDLLFRGAAFCKYVCPVGQFNFVGAAMAPFELRVRDERTCASCRTADCIAGRRSAAAPVPMTFVRPLPPPAMERRVVARGCELGIFLPAKVGNLDCTLCFDCVRACPHDNIGLMTRVPGAELTPAGRRSGIGRLAERGDLAALALLVTFGGLLNAFAMTAPAATADAWLAGAMGTRSEAASLLVLFALGIGLVPVLLVGAASALTARLSSRPTDTTRAIAIRYAFALVPLGVGVWVGHTAFHLLTGLFTAVPVVQAAAADAVGHDLLGAPLWTWTGVSPGTVWPLQIGAIVLGALGSAGVAQRLADEHDGAWAAAPWHVVIALIACTALWVLAQPMEMRGLGVTG